MSRKVIDISVWNGSYEIDWKTVKENVDGIIIRIGYRGYGSTGTLKIDTKFKEYADNCVKHNIPFGVYWFSQEITEGESIESANFIVKNLNGYKLSYPIYYDIEYSGAKNNTGRADMLDKTTRTNCAIAFCEEIKKLGFASGIYASDHWFINMLNFNKLKKYNIWCSKWNNDNGLPGKPPTLQYNMWQYTSKGKIDGIKTNVDISLDNSAFITNAEYINDKKAIKDIAIDVINGKYGNGDKRKELLANNGYDYNEVQLMVNKIINNNKNVKFNRGDTVRLLSDSKYYNGQTIPQWVKDSTLYIRSGVDKENNVMISTLKKGDITGIVNKKYLLKI